MSTPTVQRPSAAGPGERAGAGLGISADMTASPRRERRGLATIIGAFVICPCHLPLTLALLGVVLGGTAAGALLREHVWLAGSIITLVWAALTWRGLWLVRNGRSCPVPGATGSGNGARSVWRPWARRGR
jgi:mercuric ion transport protein